MSDDLDPRVRRTRRDVIEAAGELMAEQGWPGVTHAAVAERAGYSRATLYSHWPERADLVRAALSELYRVPHCEPSGDLRTDTVDELLGFGEALVQHHLGRVIATLAERAPSDPAMSELLRISTEDGGAGLRRIYHQHGIPDDEIDLLVTTLSGALVHRVMMQRREPSRDFVEAIVDFAHRSLVIRHA